MLVCGGCKLGIFEEFARKYYLEACKDLDRAMKAFREGDYPESVFHSQQCVEKAVKALIEAKRGYVFNHGVILSNYFIRVYKDEWIDDFDFIVECIDWFTEYYTRTRYPFLLRSRVYSPEEFITRDIAEEALDKARKVLDIVRKVLQRKGLI